MRITKTSIENYLKVNDLITKAIRDNHITSVFGLSGLEEQAALKIIKKNPKLKFVIL